MPTVTNVFETSRRLIVTWESAFLSAGAIHTCSALLPSLDQNLRPEWGGGGPRAGAPGALLAFLGSLGSRGSYPFGGGRFMGG
jgi:hypothetical protein